MNYKIFIIVIFNCISIPAFATVCDSISTLIKNGQTVILYEVGAKETMYSIARKYNIPPKSIVAINPEIQNTSLKAGQKIFVPYETARTVKSNTSTPAVEVSGATYHTVEKGQTLYTVARMYKVSVDDIRRWNNLVESALKTGSKIIVNMNAEVVKQMPIDITKDAVKKTVRSNTGYDKTVEKGKAELFETNEGDKYYYVQHRTLALGTVIKISNEETGIDIYARVVGKLLETSDKNIVVKLSKLAYSKISSESGSAKVQIEYLP